jgi:hypothetical protein
MKNNAIRMFLALGAACVFGSVLNAQSSNLNANVPFAFQASGKTFAAGKYVVGEYRNSGVQMVKNATTSDSVFIPGAYATRELTKQPKLVFHCYSGHGCFLAEIWPAAGHGSTVPPTKAEKELRNGDRPVEMATIAVDLRRAD